MACSGLSLTSGPSWTSLPPLEPIVPDLQGEGGLPPPPPQVRQALFPGPYTPPHSQAISRLRRFSVSSWVMDINCSILILGTKKLIKSIHLPSRCNTSDRESHQSSAAFPGKSSWLRPPRQAPAAPRRTPARGSPASTPEHSLRKTGKGQKRPLHGCLNTSDP